MNDKLLRIISKNLIIDVRFFRGGNTLIIIVTLKLLHYPPRTRHYDLCSHISCFP